MLHRIPSLEEAEIRQMINGPESFTPDGKAIVGEAPEVSRISAIDHAQVHKGHTQYTMSRQRSTKNIPNIQFSGICAEHTQYNLINIHRSRGHTQ